MNGAVAAAAPTSFARCQALPSRHQARAVSKASASVPSSTKMLNAQLSMANPGCS